MLKELRQLLVLEYLLLQSMGKVRMSRSHIQTQKASILIKVVTSIEKLQREDCNVDNMHLWNSMFELPLTPQVEVPH